jgi:sulfur carrier protein
VRVILNGAERDLPDGSTVEDAVGLAGVAPGERGVAVALDRDVVPRGDWHGTVLQPGAQIEVLRASAGG